MNSKIRKELPELVRQKVISEETAKVIENYYAQKSGSGTHRLFIIFGILGSILVGSGIILILAHNWDQFSKGTKTVLAFIPLLIGQLITGYSIYKNKNQVWKEASGTFLFFAIGSSIALISQIYNIPGDMSSYLLTWTVLSLPLIYLLNSRALMLLVILIATYYAASMGYFEYRNQDRPWMYLIILVAILPFFGLEIKKRFQANTTTLFNWFLPLSLTIALGAFIRDQAVLGFLMYISLFAVLYAIGKLRVYKDVSFLKNGFLTIGSVGTVVLFLIFSFKWIWEELTFEKFTGSVELMISIVLLLIAMILTSMFMKKNGIKKINLFQISILIFWLLFWMYPLGEVTKTIIANIWILLLGVSAIKMGSDTINFAMVNYGLIIVSVLIVCRFFDTNMSFVVRGLLFISIGAGFFVTNHILLQKQKKRKTTL